MEWVGPNVVWTDYGCDDMRHIQLPGASLFGANFGGTNLDHANLGDANLTDAYIPSSCRYANLGSAYMAYASLKLVDATGANFTGAVLRETLCANVNAAPIALIRQSIVGVLSTEWDANEG